ncbi:MAG TPA: hypothetical protein VIH71_06895 [Solirubrobacteraceae bacterium]
MLARLLIALVLLAGGAVVIVRHFDNGRSVEAACRVWDTDGVALHARLEQTGSNASGDPLNALANLAGAPGQIGQLMGEMAAVAPSNIEPDFQSLAQAFAQIGSTEGSSLSDPLGVLGSSLALGFNEEAAASSVNSFLAGKCGIPGESRQQAGR